MKKLIIPIILLSSFSGTSDYNSPFQAKLSVEEIGLFSKQQYEVLITFSETKQAAVISESGYYLTFNDNDLKQNGGEIIVKIITDEKMVYQMSLLKDINHLSLDQYNNTFYLDYYLIGKNIDIIENNKVIARTVHFPKMQGNPSFVSSHFFLLCHFSVAKISTNQSTIRINAKGRMAFSKVSPGSTFAAIYNPMPTSTKYSSVTTCMIFLVSFISHLPFCRSVLILSFQRKEIKFPK